MKEAILYVHVPFCSSKCHFCSWVSPIQTSDLVKSKHRFGDYTRAVIEEIKGASQRFQDRGIQPKLIYFGGGTPSLLSGDELVAILHELRAQFPSGGDALDTTIEMSPDTTTQEKLDTLKQGGFNRISFGVQSFNESRARSIGRAHSPHTAIKAFEMARQAGFDNINLDLMVGFPDETEEEYLDSVETALMLQPDHVSVYIYKKIPGTVMAKMIDSKKLQPCPLGTAVRRYQKVTDMLVAAGYSEYLIQLFEKGGKRCLVDYHYFNLSCDYLGFGQGAHSLMDGKVEMHTQSLEEYLQKPAPNFSAEVAGMLDPLETKFFEMMHTENGLDLEKFYQSTKISFQDAVNRYPRLRRVLQSAYETNFVERTASGMRFTDRQAQLEWLAFPPHWNPDYQPAKDSRIIEIASI